MNALENFCKSKNLFTLEYIGQSFKIKLPERDYIFNKSFVIEFFIKCQHL